MLSFYDRRYLVVEEIYRCDPFTGTLQHFKTQADPGNPNMGGRFFDQKSGNIQTFRFLEMDHFLSWVENHTPVRVRRTANPYQTCCEILSIYTFFQKPYQDQIRNNQTLHTPQQFATIGKAGLVRRMAACLFGIGWERSADVALKFATVWEMVMADPREWESIPGIGKTLAKRAYDQLRGNFKPPNEEI